MKKDFGFKKKIEEMNPAELRKQQQQVKKLKMTEIIAVDFLYRKDSEVTYEYPELIALCPMTGIPDFYTLRIVYLPDRKIPELKSLRTYLISYKDIPILHEHLANKIFEDFIRIVKPKWAKVSTNWKSRGGIKTRVEREHKRGHTNK